ncbi:hypothetical protein QTI66_02330 [Variovorax sp. J22R133]|uniref:hypothetical protein n=1 Tax=Variovorax brevis TaxID=3053503 RepID=UPI002576928D|nr:hypothetical protein [Variovorax sp. J22R133]MDM0110963.1 hypothetical protein [Variovorax sp. J22R133]
MMRALRKLLGYVVTALLVPVLLFEEWGWEPLSNFAARMARHPLWARVERRIAALPPRGALLAFSVPVVALFPIKLLALFLFGEGHFLSGLSLLIGAKIAGTAIVARLFQITQPALMQLPLFALWYGRWKYWKDRVLAMVRGSQPWRTMGDLGRRLRRNWRAFRGVD